MLSDREKKWVWIGGGVALLLLYLWLVLFPLISYHKKMQRRITRSWETIERLQSKLKRYMTVSRGVHGLIRRANVSDQKVPPEMQLKLIARNILGKGGQVTSINFDPVWEGQDGVMQRCLLRAKAKPRQILALIERIDHHYLPMRVLSWNMKKSAGSGLYDLKMEIYLFKVRRPS